MRTALITTWISGEMILRVVNGNIDGTVVIEPAKNENTSNNSNRHADRSQFGVAQRCAG